MIITYPNPILEKRAQKITDPESPEIKALILEMIDEMTRNNGLGIAAPQVGKSVRLCIIRFEGKTHILINPKFLWKSWRKNIAEEGCLSFPGRFIPVKRHNKVRVRAQNKKGESYTLKAEGLLARALQHEIDHLNGTLFINREIKQKKITL